MNVSGNPRLYASLPSLGSASRAVVTNLTALRRNYKLLSERVGDAACICVVKADAYGHGAPAVVRALEEEGCRFFAVSCVEEALAVREAAKKAEILIFGRVGKGQMPLLAEHRLTATVFSSEYARELSDEAVRLGTRFSVHIKLDTGMNRLGFAVYSDKANEVELAPIEEIFSMKGLAVTGIYSHFASADEEDACPTHRQAARYRCVVDALETKGYPLGVKHICNSAGALRFAGEYGMNAVRLGLALYGYLPDCTGGVELSPVMRLETEIAHLHTLPAHERVGYGGTYEAADERLVATVSIGYADGWIRDYSGATVTVHTASGDFRVPIIGRICMDQCMLDVTGVPARCGDKVTLFGQSQDELYALAARAGTIPYECICLISARVPRRIEEESARGVALRPHHLPQKVDENF